MTDDERDSLERIADVLEEAWAEVKPLVRMYRRTPAVVQQMLVKVEAMARAIEMDDEDVEEIIGPLRVAMGALDGLTEG